MTAVERSVQPELSEEDVTGKLKSIYDEIKMGLRVPSVPRLFRLLAAEYPDYLQVAWSSLKPNVRTAYFEERVNDIRNFAEDSVPFDGADRSSPVAPAGAFPTLHQLSPALFLSVAALRSALLGQQPKLQELASREKQQSVTPMPAELQALPIDAPNDLATGAQAIFGDENSVLVDLVRLTDFGALAAVPEMSPAAWSALQGLLETREYREFRLALRRLAEGAISSLPFRLDAQPHTLRHCGLSELQIDGVRDLLNEHYTAMPAAVLCAAHLARSRSAL